MYWHAPKCNFFSLPPDLQKRVKVNEEAIQASESEKHFLLSLLRPPLFIIIFTVSKNTINCSLTWTFFVISPRQNAL